MESIPVLIIGAGPTGLSMAIELHRYGIPFRIFDKYIKPVKTSNALAAQTRTLEVWDDLGILKDALERGIPIYGGNIFNQQKQIAEISFKHLKSTFHFLLAISQHETEDMFLKYLKDKNIYVEFQTDLIKLTPQNHFVEVVIKTQENREEIIHADWVIACDGGHSQVREACHIDFIGEELPEHFVLADLEIQGDLTKSKVNLFTAPQGILAIIAFNEKYYRIIADTTYDHELKNAKTLTFSQIQRLVNERCPLTLGLKEPIWTSGFWIHARMAKKFKSGRIFFAGDAAHIHSPVGGQGMNTGIQDANNLTWKLAYVIQGLAKEVVLDTYTIERESVAKKILEQTTLMTRIMTLRNPLLQFIRNGMLEWLLSHKNIQTKMTNTLAQLNIHYPRNILVQDCLGKKSGPRAGTRMLDVDEKLFGYVHGPKISLLCFMGLKDQGDVALYYDLAATIKTHYRLQFQYILVRIQDHFEEWSEHKIFDEDKKLHEVYGADEPCIYLIRPDKYIGFRGGLSHLDAFKQWLMESFKLRI